VNSYFGTCYVKKNFSVFWLVKAIKLDKGQLSINFEVAVPDFFIKGSKKPERI
jgi:hypothetical protein